MEKFDLHHYRAIRKERKKRGLPVAELKVVLEDHELLGKQVYDTDKQKYYIVESVQKHWLMGWYILLLLRDKEDSHGLRVWENISSGNETIIDLEKVNKETLKFT